MSEQGTSNQSVGDSALRVILQKLDSMQATLQDTQLRVQHLEEEKAQATTQTTNEPLEKPWAIQASGKDLDQVSESMIPALGTPEQYGIRAIPLWKTTEVLSKDTQKLPYKLETSQDYGVWKFAMNTFLRREGLQPFIDGSTPKPPFPLSQDPEAERLYFRWLEFDNAAEATILAAISKAQGARLTRCTTSREMWVRLENLHMHDSDVNVARMKAEIQAVSWKRNATVDEYIQELDRLADNLRMCGEELLDKDLKMILMRGLPERLETTKLILLSTGHLMTYQDLCDHLRSQVAMTSSRQDSKAYLGTGGTFPPTNSSSINSDPSRPTQTKKHCTFCKMDGHLEEFCYKKRNQVRCNKCKNKGHSASECRGGKPKKDPRVLMAITSQPGDKHSKPYPQLISGFMAQTGGKGEWVIDSGASQHMTNDLSLMKPGSQVEVAHLVHMGNGTIAKASCRGSIEIDLQQDTDQEDSVILREVLGVPDLSKNLLSVTACLNNGCDVLFESASNLCKIKHKNTIIATAHPQDGLWILNSTSPPKSALVSTTNKTSTDPDLSTVMKWHQKFGHLHLEGLLNLKRRQMVTGLEQLEKPGFNLNCQVCHQGKMSKKPFPKIRNSPRSSQILELIHSDIVGPITPSTVQGCKYILTFVDDRSHYCWSYLLAHKDDTFSTFVEWKTMVERNTGEKVKTLRTDNGGEYKNHHFQELCKQEGIVHQTSIPYTPQQNGVAERWNRTLLDTARSMMRGAPQVPTFLWGEAVMAATHVRNRCPTRGVPDDKTPVEIFTGKVPTVNYMKIWGSKTTMMTPNKDRKKFDARAKEGIFVGYGLNQKGYRVYDPLTKTVIVSRNVSFTTPTLEGESGQRGEEEEELHGWPDVFTTPDTEFDKPDSSPNTDPDTAEHRLSTSDIHPSELDTTEEILTLPDRSQNSSETPRRRQHKKFDTPERRSGQTNDGEKTKESGTGNILTSKTPNPKPRTQRSIRSSERSTTEINSDVARSTDASETDTGPHRNSSNRNSSKNTPNSNSLPSQNMENVEGIPDPTSAHLLHDAKGSSTNRDVSLTTTNSIMRDDGMSDPSNDATQNLRRSTRTRNPPPAFNYTHPGAPDSDVKHYQGYLATVEDLLTYKDVVTGDESQEWEKAINAEMNSLYENKAWTLTPLPKNKKVVGTKWIFKKKDTIDGGFKFKARLVAMGFTQIEGVDYLETYAPVLKYQSLRMLLGLANETNMHVHQMDITTAFLYGDLEEEIYIRQPEGQVKAGEEHLVCRLHKSLYGLKQSPRCWNTRLDNYFTSLGFQRLQTDSALYITRADKAKLIVAVYVDDLLILSESLHDINAFKSALAEEFRVTDLGEVDTILGLKVTRDRLNGTLTIGQELYATRILERFGLKLSEGKNLPLAPSLRLASNTMPISEEDRNFMLHIPYRQAVGALMYLMLGTRPDLAAAVQFVSRFGNNPSPEHWKVVVDIFKYVQKTKHLKLTFTHEGKTTITGYTDSDWESCMDTRRSMTGYVFKLGGASVSWCSRRQKSVALSSCEAEYVAACEATREAVWERALLHELGYPQLDPTIIYCDSQSAIQLIANPVFHDKTKHIQGKMHYVRERAQDGDVVFHKINTKANTADILTKGVPSDKVIICRNGMGLH